MRACWLLLLIAACSEGPVPVDASVAEDAAAADAIRDDAASEDASSGDANAADADVDAADLDGSAEADATEDGATDAEIADAGGDAGGDTGGDAGVDTGVDAGMLGDFGASGYVLGPTPGWAGGALDQLFGIAVDPMNRVVAVGNSEDASGGRRALIVRYDATGVLDPSFDGDGVLIGASTDDQLRHVTIDPQGRIVVVGERGDGMGRTRTLAARYLDDGQPDTTFGTAGEVVGRGAAENDVPFSGYTAFPDEHFKKVAIDSQGRLIAAGVASEINQDYFYRTLVARFTDAGALDTAFNGTGFAIGDGSNDNWYTGPQDELFSLALAGDAPRVVGWTADPNYTEELTLLIAFDTNGVLDGGFNAGTGFVMGTASSWAGGTKQVADDIAIDSAGDITTCGFSFDANNVVFAYVERYSSTGARDNTFGAGGYALARPSATNSAAEYPVAIALDGQGRIIIAGYTDDAGVGSFDRALIYRYLATGALDTSFNPTADPIAGAIVSATNGASEFAGGTDDAFNDLVITIGDRIYVAGTSNGRALIARYRDDGCLDAPGCTN